MNSIAPGLAVLALLGALGCPPARAGEEPAPPPEARGTLLVTDASWKANDRPGEGWEKPRFDDSGWPAAIAEDFYSPEATFPHDGASNLFGYPTKAAWIWCPNEESGTAWFRRRFRVPEGVSRAELVAIGDDELQIWLNGLAVGVSGTNSPLWQRRGCARAFDVLPWLVDGENVLALAAVDHGGCMGAVLELRIDAAPLQELLRESPRSVDPHPRSQERHHSLFTYPILTLHSIRKQFDEPADGDRNTVVLLWTLRRWTDTNREWVIDLLGSRIRGSGPGALDAARVAGLLGLPEASPALETVLSRATEEWPHLAAASALSRTGTARNAPALEQVLQGLRADGPDRAEIERWIPLLGADDWRERQKACDALRRLGRHALPVLREALRHDDPEVVARANLLIRFAEAKREEKPALRALLLRALERGVRILRERKDPEEPGEGR